MKFMRVTNFYGSNYIYLNVDQVITIEGLDERFDVKERDSPKYLVYTAMNPKWPGQSSLLLVSLMDACRILGFDPETTTAEKFWHILND